MIDNTAAEVNLVADYSRLASGLRIAAGLMRDFSAGANKQMASSIGPGGGKSWLNHQLGGKGSLAKKMGAAAGEGMLGLAGRGIDKLVDQAKNVWEFNDQLVRFGIATRIAGKGLDDIGAAARKTSSAIGIDSREVLAAGKAYVDLAGAENFSIKKMDLLARAAQASGAATTDLAGMMYQLTRSMKVSDAEMENTIGGLINQAKDGAVEAKQMAKEFSAMLPLMARFKDSMGREGAISAGAMFQVIRDGFNSADEAGTGLVRVFAGLRTYGSRFEKAGVRIWDVDENGVKKARKFADIFEDLSKSELIKDPEALKKAFGRTEGWRSVELLLENIPRLRQLEASGRANGVIMQDLGKYTQSAAGKMAIAFENLKNKIATAMTPERIDKFVAAAERGVDILGKLVDATKYLDPDTSPLRGNLRYIGADKFDDINPADVAAAAAMGRQIIASGQLPGSIKNGKYVEGPRIADLNDAQRKEMADRAAQNASYADQQGNFMDEAMYREIEKGLRMLRPEQDPWNTTTYGPQKAPLSPEEAAKAQAEVVANFRDAVIRFVQWADGGGPAKAKGTNVTVAVDGNPVAKASANATDKRRSP